MSTNIEQRVLVVASDLFGVPPEHFREDSSPASVEGWDSLQQLNLVLAIEQEFDVRLEPEEIERMVSIGRITELLRTKLPAWRRAVAG
jgi:acyl carrier protein